jgi:two-component system cell cycle sensor histidine kinase/response regulator CckA
VHSSSPTPARQETLFLVEDNVMVRRSIEATLGGMGYRVIAAASGPQCIEAVQGMADDPVDLLITDVVMPEMNGKELIERVRLLRPGLPVLFMSGYDQSSLATRQQPIPIEHFLQKPFDSSELATAVRKALGAPGPAKPAILDR